MQEVKVVNFVTCTKCEERLINPEFREERQNLPRCRGCVLLAEAKKRREMNHD